MYLVLILMAIVVSNANMSTVASMTTVTDVKTNPNENSTIVSEKPDMAHSNETMNALPSWFLTMNSGAAMRTFYVVAFVMSTVVIYFIIRAVRLRRRKSKSRKYGVITSTSALEMEPLEKGDDDDDEDTTLFDVHHHNKYGQK